MLFQKKLQNLFLFKVFMGLLLLVSFCFAQSGTWTPKASIPTPRCFAGSCELNGKIYVIGGSQTTSSSLNVMEVYDPVTDTWDTTKTPMPTARAELCVAAVSGKIYAIGGATSHAGSPLGMVQEYDPQTDTWNTNKQPMPTARMGAAYGVLNNKIYVAGGSPGPNHVSSDILEIYDPATDKWTTGGNMLAARYSPQGTVLNDTFFVIGGLIGSPWTGQSEVQKYDPITDHWKWGTSLRTGRVGHTADAVDGKIYVIGGDRQPPIIMNVEEYDPQTKTWDIIDPTPGPMIIHTSNVYDNAIYVFSGNTVTIPNIILTDSVYSYEPPEAAVFTVTSDSLLFPDISIGDTLIDSVMVINAGNVNLIVNSVTSSHPLFSISPTSGVISPDSNSQFYIQFRADTLPGRQQGVLVFHHNGLTSPDSIIAKADVITGIVSQDATIPRKFTLHQNYPNPFNPTTAIEFSIPKSEFVTLKIYNVLGEEVATPISERLSTGSYRYEWNASTLASGVYLYRLQAGDYVETRKMVLMK
jgi:N-acetylneuraminic acid mutarotase